MEIRLPAGAGIRRRYSTRRRNSLAHKPARRGNSALSIFMPNAAWRLSREPRRFKIGLRPLATSPKCARRTNQQSSPPATRHTRARRLLISLRAVSGNARDAQSASAARRARWRRRLRPADVGIGASASDWHFVASYQNAYELQRKIASYRRSLNAACGLFSARRFSSERHAARQLSGDTTHPSAHRTSCHVTIFEYVIAH